MNSFSFTGIGQPNECVNYIQKHFQTKCNFSSCSFNNVFQPAPFGKFLVSHFMLMFLCSCSHRDLLSSFASVRELYVIK